MEPDDGYRLSCWCDRFDPKRRGGGSEAYATNSRQCLRPQ